MIIVAASFPTTVALIVQYGAIPIFIDMDLIYANVGITKLKLALSSKTKVVMIAHSLGNSFNLRAVKDFCNKYNLWLIEDNCDALGSTYEEKLTESWGDIGTSSLYFPHHMTYGGGATYTNNILLKKIILSIRDWERDYWYESGVDNTCGYRFSQNFEILPKGYDHKYAYNHFRFNLKASDMQAATRCTQLEKISNTCGKKKKNQKKLYDGLKDLKQLCFMKAQPDSDPSWFGFMMILKDGASFTRNKSIEYLEINKIQTRNLFAGNMTRHPMFDNMILN